MVKLAASQEVYALRRVISTAVLLSSERFPFSYSEISR